MFLLGALLITAGVIGGRAYLDKPFRRRLANRGGKVVRSVTKQGLRPVRALGRRSKAAGIGWWGRWIIGAQHKAEKLKKAKKYKQARWMQAIGDLMIGETVWRCHVNDCNWSITEPKAPAIVAHLRDHDKKEEQVPWSPFAGPPDPEPADKKAGAAPAADIPTQPMTSPTGDAGPSTKGVTVAIATTTGGEVTNLTELKIELEGIVAEANAELDDARGDLARAEQDQARIERMTSTMGALELPETSLGAIRNMGDPAAGRVSAARDRVTQAEARLAGAQASLAAIQPQLNAQEALAAAGGAGKKELYTGG